MGIRESLIKSYLQDEEVYEIIGHDITVFLKVILSYLLLLGVVGLLWYALTISLGEHILITWTVSILGIGIYIKGTVDLLDRYLDALLITNIGLLLFTWDGLFSQKVTNMQRVSTETIQYEQNSFWDSIFKKGDIQISVEDAYYTFRDASHPAEKVTRILSWKEKILGRYHYTENEVESTEEKNKYEVLVEALGEVVTEYVDKKKNRDLPYQ